MAIFEASVLTARGNELLIESAAGNKIIFTRMVAGGGEYTDRERERWALEKMTALKDARQEFPFSSCKKASAQSVVLTAVISNIELEHAYKITEIGIFGKVEGEDEDFMCAVAVTKSMEESDTFPPYNGLQACEIVQDFYITISPDAEVSVNTRGACVLMEEFEEFRKSINTAEEKLKSEKLDKTGDGSDISVTFNQAGSRQNIESGSKLSVIMGIIKKVIADLKSGAFSGVANNCTTTEGGSVLDARQGTALKNEIRETMKGGSIDQDEDGNWGYKPAGADTVIPFNHGKIIELTETAVSGSSTYDVTSITNKYNTLTEDNFIVGYCGTNIRISVWGHETSKHDFQGSNSNSGGMSKSYNAENGVLTVSCSNPTTSAGNSYGQGNGGNSTATITYRVYLIQ